MVINSVRLQNFRSYVDESFEFDEGVNIIVGPNGSGKTNLLEAILVGATGRSYRARDVELVRHKMKWSRLDINTVDHNSVVKILAKGDDKVDKEYIIDGTKFSRLPWHRTIPVVLFEPSHLQLFSGGPEGRRNYIDGLLEQTSPEFGAISRKYKRALAQRNALLKRSGSKESLFAWNVRLSELGGQIVVSRQQMVQKLEEITKFYGLLSKSKDKVTISYKASCDASNYASSMLKKLEQHEKLDQERGFTGIGPHRDDLEIIFNARTLNAVVSRGEARTIMLAIKAVEMGIIEQMRGQAPILLLDDVFSELDGARRRALTELMAEHQTFITTTDADVVIKHFSLNCKIVAIS